MQIEQQEKYLKQNRLLQFPPFFTLQQHPQTLSKQLENWSGILHRHFKNNRILDCSVSELNSDSFTLFEDNSTGIPKRMLKEDIVTILDSMQKNSIIQWKGANNESFSINWVSPSELAEAIYSWAKSNKLIGYTETLKGISSGEDTEREMKFYELPIESILKACQNLEDQDKAIIYENEGMYSIKFK